jgi:hypothetical protein|nr:MAG TPA: NikA [Caudoviricetes sp.]
MARPKLDFRKDRYVTIRADVNDRRLIKELMYELDMSTSEVVRAAIRSFYVSTKYGTRR